MSEYPESLDEQALQEDDDFPIVCENGCPEGYRGRHKFSCDMARYAEYQSPEEDRLLDIFKQYEELHKEEP